MGEHVVGTTDEIESGEGLGVEVNGIEIAVFNIDGEFYAIQNVCQHKDGPMFEGEIDEENCSVFCPWHWWEWDLKTGQSPVDPNKRMRTFDTKVVDDKIHVVV